MLSFLFLYFHSFSISLCLSMLLFNSISQSFNLFSTGLFVLLRFTDTKFTFIPLFCTDYCFFYAFPQPHPPLLNSVVPYSFYWFERNKVQLFVFNFPSVALKLGIVYEKPDGLWGDTSWLESQRFHLPGTGPRRAFLGPCGLVPRL